MTGPNDFSISPFLTIIWSLCCAPSRWLHCGDGPLVLSDSASSKHRSSQILPFFFPSWTHQKPRRRSGNEVLILGGPERVQTLQRKGNLVRAFNKDCHYQKIKSIKVSKTILVANGTLVAYVNGYYRKCIGFRESGESHCLHKKC